LRRFEAYRCAARLNNGPEQADRAGGPATPVVESSFMEYLLALMGLGAAGWLWHTGLEARELATQLARERCADMDLQFLDGTVAFAGISLERRNGKIRVRRQYRFEFADGDGRRHAGKAVLIGLQIEELCLNADPAPR